MNLFRNALIVLTLFSSELLISNLSGQPVNKDAFIDPPMKFRPRPLYFWNNTNVKKEVLFEQMQAMRDKCGYGGFGVVPFGKSFKPEYLSEEYLQLYGSMIEKAGELGMTLSLYDEFGFPSGSVGAFAEGDDNPRFQKKYPELTIQRLDKTEEDIIGPVRYSKKIPDGTLMGVVAMETALKKRIDITGSVKDGNLTWDVPAGTWKLMIFTCVIDGTPISDYLNPETARKFTSMVHDVYYERFKKYFGPVIYGTFFDEPSMFHADFRMWTPEFNSKFTAKFGFSPVLFYPALWYDIGPQTEQARSMMFGFRAELYALGFTKIVNDWSVAHGITATGHTAPEEAIVPANASGDLMKSFKYLEIPGIDKIGGYRYAERFYKLISSSAYNWDRTLVMSETYGAMPNYQEPGDLTWNDMWSIANDQYSKGINMLIPHAVWYDNTKVTYKPELSHRNPLYADSLKAFTTYLSRLNVLLQAPGQHVADIAVLYPVHSLLADHYFYKETGPANVDGYVDPANQFYNNAISKIDYVSLGEWLINGTGLDFTYLHPEVLDERCRVSGNRLELTNKINCEKFGILIVPSCYLISLSNLRKIADFYNSGGTVLFTTRLPRKALEVDGDKEVMKIIGEIFPAYENDAWEFVPNANGGKACYIPEPDGLGLSEILFWANYDFDVSHPLNSDIQYIHKIVDGRNIYFFANIGRGEISTELTLRGKMVLEEWDPHSGKISEASFHHSVSSSSGTPVTVVPVSLKPVHSVFLVEKK